MQLTGISLNIMTLGGLAVAVGRVVDDAIVVLENIYRHRALGEDRLTASLNGPREVAGAITASTLTTVAVFLPLGFVGGLVSQFFLPFALTVTFALLASLICALTVVPVLAYLFIRRGQGRRRRGRRAQALDLGARLHPGHHVGPALALDGPGRRSACRPSCSSRRSRSCRSCPPSSSTPVARSSSRSASPRRPGASSEAVLDVAIEAETILLGRPRRRARPDEHPRRGRHELPDHHRGPERPPGQQRDDHRPARSRRPT